jgi:hypothetical protein
MLRIIIILLNLLFFINVNSYANETLSIEKELVGIVGVTLGTVKTETRELKTGDKIYLNDTILAGVDSVTQILLLDQSTFTIGSDSKVVMDTFIYDPKTNDGKIVASVEKGSLKVISGLISAKNPDNLTVEVPEGTLGSRGTEFQTMVSTGKTDTLLIGPGKNNTLGLRPGEVSVENDAGQTVLYDPYTIVSLTKGKAPSKAQKITKNQLKKFNKKMKASRRSDNIEKRKALKKELKKELKEAGLDKEEIKSLIKENIKKAKKEKNKVAKKKKGKKKKLTKKQKAKKKKAIKKNKKKNKKKKAIKKNKKKNKKKKAVKKKKNKKKKVVKKKSKKKKKKVVKKKSKKKKKKAVKKKKKVAKKKKIVKKKVAKKKKKAKNKRRRNK